MCKVLAISNAMQLQVAKRAGTSHLELLVCPVINDRTPCQIRQACPDPIGLPALPLEVFRIESGKQNREFDIDSERCRLWIPNIDAAVRKI